MSREALHVYGTFVYFRRSERGEKLDDIHCSMGYKLYTTTDSIGSN